jgi:ABC-type multidrug transport system ATPase subunit
MYIEVLQKPIRLPTLCFCAGLFAPTSGTATVNGYDMRTEMSQIRSSMGLCPQHNMLFNNLTVAEHLLFFGRVSPASIRILTSDSTKNQGLALNLSKHSS